MRYFYKVVLAMLLMVTIGYCIHVYDYGRGFMDGAEAGIMISSAIIREDCRNDRDCHKRIVTKYYKEYRRPNWKRRVV